MHAGIGPFQQDDHILTGYANGVIGQGTLAQRVLMLRTNISLLFHSQHPSAPFLDSSSPCF